MWDATPPPPPPPPLFCLQATLAIRDYISLQQYFMANCTMILTEKNLCFICYIGNRKTVATSNDVTKLGK